MQFNPHVRDCASAPIAEAWSWVRNPDSDRLIDMCQAVPAHLPPQALRDYLGDAIKAGEGATYTDIRGIPPLREALAENISTRYQGSVSADDILITAGCNQAFCSVIDSLCQAGDEVILPSPCYFNHEMWLSTRGVNPALPVVQPGDRDAGCGRSGRIDQRSARAHLLLVTPNNPSGAIYSPECIEGFFELARQHGLALIIDETYRDFIDIDEQPARPVRARRLARHPGAPVQFFQGVQPHRFSHRRRRLRAAVARTTQQGTGLHRHLRAACGPARRRLWPAQSTRLEAGKIRRAGATRHPDQTGLR